MANRERPPPWVMVVLLILLFGPIISVVVLIAGLGIMMPLICGLLLIAGGSNNVGYVCLCLSGVAAWLVFEPDYYIKQWWMRRRVNDKERE